jgi:hypothetical protein
MGIYNSIHPCDDDLYFYCPRNDCPCHDHYFYDASGNLNHSGTDDYFLVVHHHN